ncbi:F-box only protein 15-like isoform X1 [Epinephelus fuscoguttatus]|uniref:F-box only protein 15-like isoform X1 n=1 Tax=Epinephelus fuscoguttatus TaxID=293821 RepID=UPI0020D195D3|nr:F-box only protein 15-like isoform X1 [Epinephelus fuscoguttatus]
MAAGRGEFFRSLIEGLERKPVQPAPVGQQRGRGRGKPGTAGGRSGPGTGQRRRQRQAAPSSVSGNSLSRPDPRAEGNKSHFPHIKTSPPRNNFIERLPHEILVKIFSYLDATSLSYISHVNKLFSELSKDDVIWRGIYMSEFGCRMWNLKPAAPRVDPAEVEGCSMGHWKEKYFRTVNATEINMWRREMINVRPFTGLPWRTDGFLRELRVSWELTVCDWRGQEVTMKQSKALFFQSSVIVRWSEGRFPKYHHIRDMKLYGVRKETLKTRPGWRSLILKLDMRTRPPRFIDRDKAVKVMHHQPGFIVGVWRVDGGVAFIMVSLHLHRLVERSLLGSPVCPFSEPDDPPHVDNSDPEFGLHGYSLHVLLHKPGAEIMSENFGNLSFNAGRLQRGLLEMRVINTTDLFHHRPLSGNITLPWVSGTVEGSVEKCCIMTLTLLDEFQKPFWCLSSPIVITPAERRLSFDYDGEHFVMVLYRTDGRVELKLVWLKEKRQFFLIGFNLFIPVHRVNKRFSSAF